MNGNDGSTHPKQIMVWWVIWFAFLVGVVQIYFILGKNAAPSDANAALNFLALAPFISSSLIRWIILPRMRLPQTALVVYLLGLAFAESSVFLGLFLFPAHKQELFVLSLIGLGQFVPFFARRYFP